MGRSKNSSKREVYSNSISPQETRKITNKQSNLHLKQLEKEEEEEEEQQQKPEVSRRKEIVKIRAEINEIEMTKTIAKINKSWFFEKINKFDKPLARLIKKKWERMQINKKGEMKRRNYN